MKRVGCLYRVSTYKQTYQNDIPVQREACLKFINKKEDWKFEKEYIELGVSGYKTNTDKRDALQYIKQDVIDKKIDVFLVFMFDRIGRQEKETPLVVKWLIEQGIEVWSVNEGQRTIKNRDDILINYITYWQAEGESIKTSLRSTERRIQLTKEGVYMGYYPPYGYKLVDSDEITKIGKIRKKLEIYPDEAKIIKKIFYLFLDKEYGTNKIAIFLNCNNIERRKKGIKWNDQAILEIIRNPIYKGYVSFMKRTRRKDIYSRNKRNKWILADKANNDIIIIEENDWDKANSILDARSRNGKRVIRLLSGLTRCGYCNSHITPKGKGKYVYMYCKEKQNTGYCEYTGNYRADKLENIVSDEIKKYLLTFKKVNLKQMIKNNNNKINRRKEKLNQINREIIVSENRLQELKHNIINALMENNEDKKIKINQDIKCLVNKLKDLNNNKEIITNEILKFNEDIDKVKDFIPNWINEFDEATLEDRRIIVNKIIDKIYLYNDRIKINVKFPISDIIVKGKDYHE